MSDIICNKLVKTYNSNILDKADTNLKNLFLTTAEISRQINLKKGNTTILSLLDNYTKNDTPIPKYIGGPKTLSLHWNQKYEMTIYIFGEYHASEDDCYKFHTKKEKDCPKGQIRNPATKRCVSKTGVLGKKILAEQKDQLHTEKFEYMLVEDFLFKLVKTTPVFLDIYVEFAAFKDTGKGSSFIPGNRIGRIFDRLKQCLYTYSRDSELCDLLRLHYIDIRKGDKEVNPISHLRKLLNYQLDSWTLSTNILIKNFKKIFNNDELFVKTLKNLNTSSLPEYKKFITDQILENPPTLKEMNKSFLKDEILSFVTTKIVKEGLNQREYFQRYIPILLNKNASDSDIRVALSQIYNSTVSINAKIVDVYALSRIFKRFDTTKSKGLTTNNNYQPEFPHNIIIYAGDAHSIIYRDFLDFIGTKELVHTDPKKIEWSPVNNCIDLTGFPMPFFKSFPPK